MAHPRKLIRKAVEARLKAANTMAGVNIFGNRARQIFPQELPCILVYTKSEPVEVSTESPREYRRNLTVALELVAKAESEEDLDDILDDFAEEVENAIFSDETFGELVSDTILGETDIELLTEGETPIGAAKITLSMPYYQRLPGDLSGDLDDFKTVDTKIDLAPTDGTKESEDRVTLSQE